MRPLFTLDDRMQACAALVREGAKLVDVGTDHALLPIYLIKNNIVALADGSDISKNVLNNAIENVAKYNLEDKINLYLSDGTKAIDISKYNTLVITGMGFTTIKGIIDNTNLEHINKLIIQSNNNLNELRMYMSKISYRISDEVCLKDKGINYSIIKYVKGKEKLSKQECLCGKYKESNKWFYKENLNNINKIIDKVTDKKKIKELNKLISYYNDYISK